MQPELIEKKKEIISAFLKNGVLLTSEILNELDNHEKLTRIFEVICSRKEGSLILDLDVNKLLEESKKGVINIQEPASKANVKVLCSYKEEAKKREPQDFVDYFSLRYKGIEKILKERQEFRNTVSINKTNNKADKENVTIIGIVSEKRITKNGNLMLVVEDPTGQKKIIINKNKPSVFNEAKDIVLDEVIGIVGVTVETVIFANNIVWPDIPTNRELRKSEDESYALFLSDLHVGSSKFLPQDFDKFLKWIKGEAGNEQQRNIAKNVQCIFIAGDLVDGCGIYPEQDKELEIKDIYDQYKECARLLKQIPGHIPLVICPGNHDALRLSEPQPPLSKDYAKAMFLDLMC